MKWLEGQTIAFEQAAQEGKQFYMRKYKRYGEYHNPKIVSAEVALKKSKVLVEGYYEDDGWFCPYEFQIIE